jgi:integrase
VFRAFRALWIFAEERDPDLGRHPVRRLRKQWYPVPIRTGMVPADRLADWCRAVQALPNSVQRDYLLLLLFTGMRSGETTALRWDDVDFRLGVIRQPAERTKAKRKLDLPMTDLVRGLLVARQSIGRDASGFVFPANSRSGHIEEPKFPLQHVTKATALAAAKKAGVKISDDDEIRAELIKKMGIVVTPHGASDPEH